MNRRELLLHTTGVGAAVAAVGVSINAAEFGTQGDGSADDAPALQAALDHVGASGGGTVYLPKPRVHYRIATGLTLPSYTVLAGAAPVHYPYNAGNRGVCALVADFSDARQWMIEPATRGAAGRKLAHDDVVSGVLPQGVTYNCGVRDLLLTSKGKVPFGGIRMHGCPGSIVSGVSVDRVGCGLLVNYSFGGSYQLLVNSLYYGVVAWDDCNANTFSIHCLHAPPWPKSIPPEYRLPFMAQMKGHYATTLALSSEEHLQRPYGLVCGSVSSTSIGNVFEAIIEQFPGGIFLYKAYATDLRQCYLEGNADVMDCGLAASRSRFSIQAFHAFLSGTGTLFDFGTDVQARIASSGILNAATFGKPPQNDGFSSLLFEGVSPTVPGAPIQPGIRYGGSTGPWLPLQLRPGWRAATKEIPAVRLDPYAHRVELRGEIAGAGDREGFVLPSPCRPPARRRYAVAGGEVTIDTDGSVHVKAADGAVSLDGVSFALW